MIAPTAAAIAHYVVAAVDGILLQHLVTGDEAAARNNLEMLLAHAMSLLGPAATPTDGQNNSTQQPEQNV